MKIILLIALCCCLYKIITKAYKSEMRTALYKELDSLYIQYRNEVDECGMSKEMTDRYGQQKRIIINKINSL